MGKKLVRQRTINNKNESVLGEKVYVDSKKTKSYNRDERMVLGMKSNTTNTKVNEDILTEDMEIKTYYPEVRDGVIIITKDIMSKDEWDEWE